MKMSKVLALLSFGIGLFAAGLYWMLFDSILQQYFASYMLRSTYFRFANMEWNIIPVIIMLIGIMSMIFAALIGRATRTVVNE